MLSAEQRAIWCEVCGLQPAIGPCMREAPWECQRQCCEDCLHGTQEVLEGRVWPALFCTPCYLQQQLPMDGQPLGYFMAYAPVWNRLCHVMFGNSPQSDERRCATCNVALNGSDQEEAHYISRKHRKRKKKVEGQSQSKPANKGIDIPTGTALILEQTAIWNDAVQRYMSSLYARAALKSRL